MSDTYHLQVSFVQLERIYKALLALDKADPINEMPIPIWST
jgi:hypothetical protein